jgi:hypothetical protein
MRFGLIFGTLCACLLFLAAHVHPADTQPTPPPPATNPPADSQSSNAAAEKHAKRMACLKVAKEKKLVGEKRDTYVKNCLEQPAA